MTILEDLAKMSDDEKQKMRDDFNRCWGRQLVRARVIAKLSRKSMARLLGISESELREYESGKKWSESVEEKCSELLQFKRDFFYRHWDFSDIRVFSLTDVIHPRDLASIREMALHRARGGVPTLVDVLHLPIFEPKTIPETMTAAEAHQWGRETAEALLPPEGSSLDNMLERLGIYMISINTGNPLFRGFVFIAENIPIIVVDAAAASNLYMFNNWLKTMETVARGLGYIYFLKTSDSDNNTDKLKKAETLRAEFVQGILDVWKTKKCKFSPCKLDFFQRKAVEAWRRSEISGSRAAEILGTLTGDFYTKMIELGYYQGDLEEADGE